MPPQIFLWDDKLVHLQFGSMPMTLAISGYLVAATLPVVFLPGSLMLLTMVGDVNDSFMRLRLGGTNMEFIPDVSNTIGTDQWIHAVVVVPDDAVSSADIQMYINGVNVPGTLEPGDAHV